MSLPGEELQQAARDAARALANVSVLPSRQRDAREDLL